MTAVSADAAEVAGQAPEETAENPRLAILLAMAMFVLVVDTSIMNVSISSVVRDLGTTVSGVQSAIALEALVSAAFILLSSKIGDLIGRKRAYVLGLLGYAVGAIAMTLARDLEQAALPADRLQALAHDDDDVRSCPDQPLAGERAEALQPDRRTRVRRPRARPPR